ncbi:ATP-dependent DNA helicase sgs1 [Puccinia graminis f. sp. tritici]|nr:ATP-dependent DNA helicase sgs1 [Puccinia graminis f. sp. tritici]
MFCQYQKAVVIVLNPLDALGDNQVEEKKDVGASHMCIPSINLTKDVLNEDLATRLIRGDYGFVYVSPEAFLNSEIFREVYFNPVFQSHLVSVVVDEAHMIYVWGLVASGKIKHIASHVRHPDRALFRPFYGQLAARLMATNGAPLLLMSATCRPVAISSILESLKVAEDQMHFVRAELTRPEIRIIRIPMKYSIGSCDDLLNVYSRQAEVPDSQIVPTLIYSTTRNLTWQVLKAANDAREDGNGEKNPFSTFARRYHSCTGDMDKADITKGFVAGRFPLISCTMALGLGQNWKRVRSVIHLGRGDPASISQMIGRCGRDGRPGLAIIFVEPNRKNGRNSIDDFDDVELQTDDNRMDALAITPICLRIAFSLDNLLGYIPMSVEDPNYRIELEREIRAGFAPCACSNCNRDGSDWLVENLRRLNLDNFDNYISTTPEDIDDLPPLSPAVTRTISAIWKNQPRDKPLIETLESFAQYLVRCFKTFYDQEEAKGLADYEPEVYFGIELARGIAQNLDCVDEENIKKIIGGELIKGEHSMLLNHISSYRLGNVYEGFLQSQKEAEDNLIFNMNRLRAEKEAQEESRLEGIRNRREAVVALQLQKSEQRRVAKEVKEKAAEKKRLKKADDMIQLEIFKAEAAKRKADAAFGPRGDASGSGSIDPSLM